MFNVYTGPDLQTLEAGMFDRIKEQLQALRASEDGPQRILLIVPAQFTLKAEETAFSRLGGDGFFDFHIMSGNKLQHDILRETGGPGLTPVNNLGRTMLLRKIAAENSARLKRFSKLSADREFLKLAGDFIVQMKQNLLEPGDLDELAEKAPAGSLLSEKLSDMKLLAEGYEGAMAGRFTDSEDMLAFVTEKVRESQYIRDSVIWYYGFYSFTGRETAFLAALADRSAGLNVTLLKTEDPDLEELFSPAALALAKLKAACLERRIPFEVSAMEPEEAGQKQAKPLLYRCSTPLTQAETVGTEILRLVREEDLSFGEIAVLTADGSDQAGPIARVLEDMGIPAFIDSKRSVMHSPAASLLTSLLDIAADGMTAESVLGFVKPGLIDLRAPMAEAGAPELTGAEISDALEGFQNYLREYKVRGKAFLNPLKYGKDKLGEEFGRLEQVRAAVISLIRPFTDRFSGAKTGKERCIVLYSYLAEDLHLPQLLEEKAIALAEEGYPDGAEELAQSWSAICSLLDQLVELLGSEPLSARQFRDMIEDALGDIKLGVLPQAEGRVQLGTVTRSRLSGIRALFVCGMNDGIIPSGQGREALLTDRELQDLEALGFTLSKRSRILQAEEELEIHMTLTQPVERLYISWCCADAAGEGLKPSPLIAEMKEKDPSLTEKYDVENDGSALPFLQGKDLASEKLLTELRKAADLGSSDTLSADWRAVYNRLLSDCDPFVQKAETLLTYDTSVSPLDQTKVRALFTGAGGEFSFSSSRLELFSACPFSHFVRYGLRPDEEETFEINSQAAGLLHHQVLMTLSKRLSRPAEKAGIPATDPKSPWMTVTDEELAEMVKEIIKDLSDQGFDGLLKATEEDVYRTQRLRQVCLDFARQMVRQVRLGSIDAMYFETAFGRGRTFPPVKIETPCGNVFIEGRIDRIDVLNAGDEKYIKILDYKSGSKVFDAKSVGNGLSLQLATYLEGAVQGTAAKPGAMFYFLIRDLSPSVPLSDAAADQISDEIARKLFSEYGLSGMVVNDPGVLGAIDRSIPAGGTSDIIGYKTDKQGKGKAKGLVSEEEFGRFRDDFRQTLGSICASLTSGRVSPRRRITGAQTTSCTYCAYKQICLYGIDGK